MQIKTDSRKVNPGDIYVALRGVSQDGHDYIQKAIENGASKIICEEGTYPVETEIVKDTRTYLANYLKVKYQYLFEKMKLIAVTGTNGKTTTAYLLNQAFWNLGIKSAYIGTIGFFMDKKIHSLANTTPDLMILYELFLEAYEKGCKYICLEASSQGIAYRRIEGLKFDYAIFTNLTQDHLDFHKTVEQYAKAKQQLFYMLKEEGTAIINYDDPYKELFLLPQNKNITYGFDGGDYHIIDYHLRHLNTEFTYQRNQEKEIIESPLLGKYNIQNIITGLIILREEGIPVTNVKKSISRLQTPSGRMEVISNNNSCVIVDYAHTPDAIQKLIETVKTFAAAKLYAVFGCTGDRDRTKRPLMTELVTQNVTYAIITSDDLHDEPFSQIVKDMTTHLKQNNYEIIMDRKKAIQKGISLLKPNDILLVLGKGHEEFMIVKDQKIPFHDATVIKELLEKNIKNGNQT